jgi:hypothetical protein
MYEILGVMIWFMAVIYILAGLPAGYVLWYSFALLGLTLSINDGPYNNDPFTEDVNPITVSDILSFLILSL